MNVEHTHFSQKQNLDRASNHDLGILDNKG